MSSGGGGGGGGSRSGGAPVYRGWQGASPDGRWESGGERGGEGELDERHAAACNGNVNADVNGSGDDDCDVVMRAAGGGAGDVGAVRGAPRVK